MDYDPLTGRCNQCDWFNYAQVYANLHDSNPDNDFVNLPDFFPELFL